MPVWQRWQYVWLTFSSILVISLSTVHMCVPAAIPLHFTGLGLEQPHATALGMCEGRRSHGRAADRKK